MSIISSQFKLACLTATMQIKLVVLTTECLPCQAVVTETNCIRQTETQPGPVHIKPQYTDNICEGVITNTHFKDAVSVFKLQP